MSYRTNGLTGHLVSYRTNDDFYMKPSVLEDFSKGSGNLEENANVLECVGKEFRGIRMPWKRMPMKPSALVKNFEGSG